MTRDDHYNIDESDEAWRDYCDFNEPLDLIPFTIFLVGFIAGVVIGWLI